MGFGSMIINGLCSLAGIAIKTGIESKASIDEVKYKKQLEQEKIEIEKQKALNKEDELNKLSMVINSINAIALLAEESNRHLEQKYHDNSQNCDLIEGLIFTGIPSEKDKLSELNYLLK